jgi:hypothetical protein
MNNNKQNLPVVSRDNSDAYKLLLKKARQRYNHDKLLTYKPALVSHIQKGVIRKDEKR